MKKLCSAATVALLTVSMALQCFAANGDIGIVAPAAGEEIIFHHTFDGSDATTGNNGDNSVNTAVYAGGTISTENPVYGSDCLLVTGFSNYVDLGVLKDGWYRVSFMHRADWVNQEETSITSPSGIFMLEENGTAVDLRPYDSYNISYALRTGNANFSGNDFSKGYTIYCARTNQHPLPVSVIFKATEGKSYKFRYGTSLNTSGKNLQMLVDDVKLTKMREANGEPLISTPAPTDLYKSQFNYKAVAYNNTGYSGDAVIISAAYNASNKCVGINYQNVTFTGEIGESKTLSSTFVIGTEEDTSDYKVKTYVWDNITDGNPVALIEDAYTSALNPNAGFEALDGENSFANWTFVGDGMVEASTDAHSGLYSAKIIPSGAAAGITMGTVYGLRSVYGKGVYKLSAKVKAVDKSARISLSGKYWNHLNNGTPYSIDGSTVTASSDSWVEISYEMDESAESNYPETERCYMLNLTSDMPFLVDDFKIEKIHTNPDID